MPPPNWNLQPYVGCYVHAATSTTVVITASGRKLTLVVWGTANMPIGIVPYNIRSSVWPADLFLLAQGWPYPNVEGRAESISWMNFNRSSEKAVEEWRGGRSLERLDAPRMRLVAFRDVDWEGMNKIQQRVRGMLKNKHADMRRIMRVYTSDEVGLFRDILAHYDQGI